MSEFAPQGGERFPNLFADSKRVAELSEWTTPMLEERATQYVAFLQSDNLMPRAREQATRFLDHVMFELSYKASRPYANTPRHYCR